MTRLDIAVFVSCLQKSSGKALVLHARRLNAVVRFAQRHPKALCYKQLPEYPDTLAVVSDSAFKAETDSGLSMRGCVEFRASSQALAGTQDVPLHILDYAARAQRHVTRSTFSSELFSLTDTLDSGLVHILALHELQQGPVTLGEAKRLREEGGYAVALNAYIDAMSVFAATVALNLKRPAEQSLLVHLMWVRQLLERRILTTSGWTDTRDMCADGLTKGATDRQALQLVMDGVWRRLHDLRTWPAKA